MPMYEYTCGACNHAFEKLSKISEADQATCPKCEKPATRQLSRTAFHLQGGGWYSDGYGSGGGKSASASVSESAPSTPKTGGCGGSCACAHN